MGSYTGTVGTAKTNNNLYNGNYISTGITVPDAEYPTQIVFTNLHNYVNSSDTGTYWNNNLSSAQNYTIYLSNSNGSIKYSMGTVSLGANGTNITQTTFTANCPDLHGQAIYFSGSGPSTTNFQLRNGSTAAAFTMTTAAYYTGLGAPTVTLAQNGNGKLKVSWSGATYGEHNDINQYSVYLSTSKWGDVAYIGSTALHTYVSTSNRYGEYTFTVNNQTTYYAAVCAMGTAGSNYYSGYAWSDGVAASYKTNCTAPTSVSLSRTKGTVTITWSGQQGGTNNPITSYTVLRNTSASESGATTVSSSGSSGMTNAPGAGTFYYGVRSVSSFNTTGYKWSGSITVPTKPSVSAGDSITDTQMDNLRTWINTSGITDIADQAQVKASEGNTYRNTLTAGTSKVEASWYNTAAN